MCTIPEIKRELVKIINKDGDVISYITRNRPFLFDIIMYESADCDNIYGLTCYLFSFFDIENKKYLIEDAYNRGKLSMLMNKLLSSSCEDNNYTYQECIENILGKDVLEILRELLETYKDDNYLKSIFSENNELPEWVDNMIGDTSGMTHPDMWKSDRINKDYLITIEKNKSTRDYETYGDNIIDEDPDHYCYDGDVSEFVKNIPTHYSKYKDKSKQPSVYRAFGPLNNSPNYTCNDNLGGCRMLDCTHNDCGDFNHCWWNGICDICKNKIKEKHYSLRKPLVEGGWTGCYCSFDCLRMDTINDYFYMIDDLQEELETNMLSVKI